MPTKGSAVFWVNVKSYGAKNELQEHGGCPIFEGSKYVLGRWIYQYDQWKNNPCNVDPNFEDTL